MPADFDAVYVRDLSRHYGRRRALSRVTLDCLAGRIVGLFGPNGSGKSTLLGVLATLMRPTSGDVHYGDRPAAKWGDELRRHIGVLGHDLFLYADLTARENLEFFANLYGLPDAAARVEAALAAARLTERAHDRAGKFSRGLRQRLALERALLHRPRLVLLDEPFTGLDDASAAVLVERIRALRTERAIVVMATHDFELADGLVDDAICLREGRTIAMDGDGALRQRYRDAVARAAR
ncbi:MAG: heme ABC exporter ATP-binding protein CcmA [Acidobacteria bacterium]|nr:heme ABC exporter ATP-binding protein CcmA [Acidobacteriota bacterium]